MKFYQIIIALIVFCATACSKDDLYSYPSSDSTNTEILGFRLLNESGENVITNSVINKEASQITIRIIPGNTLQKLFPTATVSEGVIVSPALGIYTDFSAPVKYTLVAGDRKTERTWEIMVSE